MTERSRKTRRVIRPLSDDETARLAEARREAEAARHQIVREGREAKAAWMATRREVDSMVGALKARRQELGLSLADVEQRSGLRRSVLSRLENDPNGNPTLLTLQRYAAAVGMTLRTTMENANRRLAP